MKPRRWKTLARRDVVRDRWLRLRADRCELQPGVVLDPFYVMEEPDWVHTVALNATREILLVRQYRYPADVFTWELPGGWINAGEEPLVAAQRELREETGATASRWSFVAALHPNPARQTNRVHCFLAEEASVTSALELDATEAIECGFFSVSAVHGLIRDGSFSQATHVGLFHLALPRLGA